MKDLFEQWSKQAGKMWAPWQELTANQEWLQGGPLQAKWSSWLAALRSTYDVNCGWWQTFIDQTEEIFFKTYKESPLYNQTIEDQMREFGNGIRKAQAAQKAAVKDYLDKMEELLKEKEDKR
jgi:hypothetical protein